MKSSLRGRPRRLGGWGLLGSILVRAGDVVVSSFEQRYGCLELVVAVVAGGSWGVIDEGQST